MKKRLWMKIIIALVLLGCFGKGLSDGVTNIWDLAVDYGMASTNAKPAADAAVSDAVSYLNSNPSDTVILYFPAGEWNFHHPDSDAMLVEDFTSGNLVFRGAGMNETTLIFDQFDQAGIRMEDSLNITIEQMHMTRPDIYVSQGDVVFASPYVIRFKMHDGFKDPVWLANQPRALDNARNLLPFDGSNPMEPIISTHANKIVFTNIVLAARTTNEYNVYVDSGWAADVHNLAVGDQIAVKCKVGQRFILGQDASCITVQDMRFTRGSAAAIRLNRGSHQLIQRIQIDRGDPVNGRLPFFAQPGGGIVLTSTGDGGDLCVRDNVLIGTGDDAVATLSESSEFTGFMTNIVIEGNTIRGGQRRGIILSHADGAIVRSNNSMVQSGISIYAYSLCNTRIEGNTIVDNRTGPGIQIEQKDGEISPFGNQVISNVFVKANTNVHSIVIGDSSDTEVSGNMIVSWSDGDAYTRDNFIAPAPLLYAFSSTNIFGDNIYLAAPDMPLVGNDSCCEDITAEWNQTSGLIPPVDDGWTWYKNPGTNYGTGIDLRVKEDDGGLNTRDTFLKFLLLGYTAISKAVIVLPVSEMDPIAGLPHALVKTDTNWDEITLTCNTAPSDIGESFGRWVPQQPGAGVVDVTTQVCDILADGGTELSVRIVSENRGNDDLVKYGSFENEDPTLNPALVVWDGMYAVEPAHDAYVCGGIYSNENYGAEDDLRVKTGSPDNTRQSFMKFDIQPVSSVSQAILRISCINGSASNHSLYQAATGWQEDTITYATRPDRIGDAIISGPVEDGTTYMLDVTSVVQSRVDNGATWMSFSIISDSADPGSYASKEYENEELHPMLMITP